MERTKTKGHGVIIAKNIGTPVKRVGRFTGKPLNWKKNGVDDRGFQSQNDSGASDHMTGSSRFFSTYTPCAGNSKIKIADGSFSTIAGKGTIKLSPSLEKVSGKMISSARESGGLYFLDNGNNSLQLNPICLNFELYFCFE
ncbi:hypothetical protein KY284_032874 [Solanum tuberosum]|nr:hypothetical protein KY284_032874 [Solanum tuberosum]